MKLNHQRSERFYFDDFAPAASKSRDVEIKADTYWVFSRNWAVTLILGLICSLFPLGVWVGIETDAVVGFVLVLMFLRTPINDLMSDVPSIISASVSLQKIDSLVLPDYAPEFEPQLSASSCHRGKELLVFEGVQYGYSNNKDEYSFQLGPVDLSIKAGELIFIIGGNGSGKSTLAKLITGLYSASGGEIRLNGEALTDKNKVWYRSHFSTVFSTFYLFDRLVGPQGDFDRELAQAFLVRLKMDHKVTIEQQKISTTRLSQGQRKRMALLLAYVEERPIWLLDEWAADQDPSFRAYFYLELLPELKRMGKTIIAISHDDHYFHMADRIFKCDSGELVLFQDNSQDMTVGEEEAAHNSFRTLSNA
jgi:putative ATP-binding cassette transporter